MNDIPSPPPPPMPEPAPKKNKAVEALIGAFVGMGPGLLALLLRKSDALVALFLLSVTIWPLAAIILAVIPASRRFGLGMLLGVGFTVMVIFAVCGGMNTSGFH